MAALIKALAKSIGPKLAITILSGISVADFASAILMEDVKVLSSIQGVGKKTAARLVMELREAVDSPYFVGLLDSGQWYGSPGIGEGPQAYGKPEGTHGSPRGTLDPAYDYLESIRTAANSGKSMSSSLGLARFSNSPSNPVSRS